MIRINVHTIVAAAALVTGMSVSAAAAPSAASAKSAFVRVVHGSPDAGPVTVLVDGKPALKNFVYGTVTPYAALPAGTYRLAVATAGGASVGLRATVMAGQFYSIVATGELSPKAAPKKPNIALTAYVDAPFGAAHAAINFHHAAPAVLARVPFGVALLANPADVQLGSATFGTATGPLALAAGLQNTPIELYAVDVEAVTLVPNQIHPRDFRNTLPSAAGSDLAVYAIDGPAAASVPTASGNDTVRLVGTFDSPGR